MRNKKKTYDRRKKSAMLGRKEDEWFDTGFGVDDAALLAGSPGLSHGT